MTERVLADKITHHKTIAHCRRATQQSLCSRLLSQKAQRAILISARKRRRDVSALLLKSPEKKFNSAPAFYEQENETEHRPYRFSGKRL